jgi:tRNA-modifying protein YgfZ
LIRVDRATDALEAGTPLAAGGLTIRVTDPDELRTSPRTVA